MGRRLAGWRRLTWLERGQLLLCVPGLLTIHLLLAILGYRRTQRLVERLTRRASRRAATDADLAAARVLARLAAIAGRHSLGDATCLRRALLVHGWLRRRGLDPRLHLGIKPAEGPFQAHAWVELDGRRLLPADDGHRAFKNHLH